MPRPGPRTNEKSKDFFGSMKRLLKNLNPWKYVVIFALILAMVSAILSLIAPNKLSDFTDIITDGLKPNTTKLEKITTSIMSNFDTDKLQNKTFHILADSSISQEDSSNIMNLLNELKTVTSQEEAQKLFLSLPDSTLLLLIDDIKVDNQVISKEDELACIKVLLTTDTKDTNSMLKKFDELPTSVYNLVKPKIDMDLVYKYVFFLASLYVISAIFSYIQNFSMTTVSNHFAKKLRSSISTKINKLPLKFFDTHETGDILSRVTNDVDTISQNLNQSLASLVSSITLFIGSVIMMFVTNWIMALTAILSSLIGFSLMFLILGKSQKYFTEKQEQLGELNGYIEEIYSGHNVVKAYNGGASSIHHFQTLNEKLYNSNRKSNFLSGLMQPIMGFIGNFGYVAVCIVGALLVINNQISFGVIVAFIIYVRLFTNPLTQIAQAMTYLQSTAAASERVFEFLDEKEMTDEKDIKKHLDKSKVKGEIEFKHVKFSYDNTREIIKDFSVHVKPGEKVAIVGPTGAGKTTMVNLLMKFYEINDGDILIDGVSIHDLSRENIHELFCMVLQDTWLFEGTILDNIKFNKENVTEEEIWNSCKTVGVDHFIKTLPGGLHSEIGDTDTVSGGEKQLLTIARGMLEDAPFLILDEATSNVDTRTEELVQQAMDKLTEGKTSFIIAHRLSTIKNADIILVMKDGNIIETGNHEELIAQNGFYADLYNSQFEL
jgi:ABC superfamily ATP binding cassette transporter, permease/ABC protein